MIKRESTSKRGVQNVAKLRLNMLFAGSAEGAHRACILLGIVATCRAVGVPVQAYLAWAFERLDTHRDVFALPLDEITPAALKRAGPGADRRASTATTWPPPLRGSAQPGVADRSRCKPTSKASNMYEPMGSVLLYLSQPSEFGGRAKLLVAHRATKWPTLSSPASEFIKPNTVPECSPLDR
jgi:hypothetical protein